MSDPSTILDLPAVPSRLVDDPVLRRARAGLREIYGERLAGVILYGSRARGDQRPDSDYDLLVLIRDYDRDRDWRRELHELGDALFQLEPHEIEVNFYPMNENALRNRTIFMHNVRAEGFRL